MKYILRHHRLDKMSYLYHFESKVCHPTQSIFGSSAFLTLELKIDASPFELYELRLSSFQMLRAVDGLVVYVLIKAH